MTYNDMIDTMQDAFRAFYALKNACVTLSVAAQEARKGGDAKCKAGRMTPGDAERVEAVQKRFYGILNALVEARPFLVAAEDGLVWHRYPLEEALGTGRLTFPRQARACTF